MRITLKLFATLGDYLPAEFQGQKRNRNELAIDVPDGATIEGVIERFHLPPKLVHLVVVNGVFVHPKDRAGHHLQPNDELAMWPPIAGG
jgi:sulfur carrier protein ThiS